MYDFIDRGVEIFGCKHREKDPYHGEGTRAKTRDLRNWLNGKYNVIGQDRATDWLRAALGHICLDDAYRELYYNYSRDEIFDSAYRYMYRRRWTKKKFAPKLTKK